MEPVTNSFEPRLEPHPGTGEGGPDMLLGVVEGLTEFLPVSSTGHQIIVADLIGFGGGRAKAFNIIIQLGAILAVVWEYRAKILEVVLTLPREPRSQRFTVNLLLAFLPAAVLGVAFADQIHEYLFNPLAVAVALVLGGVVMLWAERREHTVDVEEVDAMDWHHALKVGCAQCLALVPGTSRSGATIIGGLLFGLSRRAATEFSFFLAMPTMVGAAVYSGYKYRELFHAADLPVFAVGTVVSFFAALVCIRWLIRYVSSHDFVPFAWYRIVFGGIVLLTATTGWVSWVA